MAETLPGPEQSGERPLDRSLVVGRLQEYGVNVELEDFEGLDDNEVMGDVTTYALEFGIDMDEIFPEIFPVVKRFKSELGEVSEKDEI